MVAVSVVVVVVVVVVVLAVLAVLVVLVVLVDRNCGAPLCINCMQSLHCWLNRHGSTIDSHGKSPYS